MDEARRSRRLRVTSGLHRGAEVELAPASITIIGSAPDADVVLADAGVAPRHLALRVEADGGASVRLLDGPARIDGQALAAARWQGWRDARALDLGDGCEVTLQVEPAHVEAGATPAPEPGSADTPACTPPAAPGRAPSGGAAWLQRHLVATSATLAIALSVGVAAASIAGGARTAPTRAEIEALVAALPQGAGALRLAGTAGAWRVHGVADAATAQAMRQAIELRRWPVTLQTVSPAQLVAAAQEVFRTRGVATARVTYLDRGRLEVAGADPDDAAVQRAAADARRDLPDLSELRFAPYQRPPEPPRPVTDPGKRLAAIVHAATPYVATADGSRFFVGSVLPDGHTLLAITDAGLRVERGGREAWLSF